MESIALLIGSSLNAGTVLAIASLGLLINEKAGIVNLGAEGMMLCAALAGFAATVHTGSPLVGFGAGMLAGALLAASWRRGVTHDEKRVSLVVGACVLALVGTAGAVAYRDLTDRYLFLGIDERLRAQTWVIFATPFATFWGWFFARRGERLWAAAICFCIYFFAPFIAARYESCAVVWAQYGPLGCFTATGVAREIANTAKHVVYFQAIVVVHVLAALGLALQRALSRSTISAPSMQGSGVKTP